MLVCTSRLPDEVSRYACIVTRRRQQSQHRRKTESSIGASMRNFPARRVPFDLRFLKKNNTRRFILVSSNFYICSSSCRDQRIETTRKGTMQISEISPRKTTFSTSSFGNFIYVYNWLAVRLRFFQFWPLCELVSPLGFVRKFFGQADV